MRIGDVEIEEVDRVISWVGPLAVDGDGAPNCYGNPGLACLDNLANAGHPGSWWALVTDNGRADGNPVVQGPTDPAPGFYVSQTALVDHSKNERDPSRYVDSSKVNYVVIPPEIKELGVKMGDVAFVKNQVNDLSCCAVVADIGGHSKVGEGSIALAKSLGLSGDCRHGGTERNIISVTLFVSSSQGWPRAQEDIVSQTHLLLSQLKGA